MDQDPTAQVRAELALDVPGERPLVLLAGFGEEGLEVLGDQLVEQRLFGSVALMAALPPLDGRPRDVGHDRSRQRGPGHERRSAIFRCLRWRGGGERQGRHGEASAGLGVPRGLEQSSSEWIVADRAERRAQRNIHVWSAQTHK